MVGVVLSLSSLSVLSFSLFLVLHFSTLIRLVTSLGHLIWVDNSSSSGLSIGVFLPEWFFLHRGFHLALLTTNLCTWALFACTHWTRYVYFAAQIFLVVHILSRSAILYLTSYYIIEMVDSRLCCHGNKLTLANSSAGKDGCNH